MSIKNSKLPNVAIAFFSYNQENFIEESIKSCLDQDYEKLTIIISDDCSTDKTYEIIKKTIDDYSGQHKIKINRNKYNLGIGKHFAFVMDNLVDEELVVMCAGDDISLSNRVSRIVEEWISNGKPSLVTHGLIEINELGAQLEGIRSIEQKLRPKNIFSNNTYAFREYVMSHYPIPALGAVNAYKMETYKKFGTPITYSDYEDHLMLTRSLLDDGVHYFKEKLVYYRVHADSHTSQKIKPFYDQKESLLSQFLNKKHQIKEKYINCYQSQKVFVQQWIDYKNAINVNNTQIDYHLVEHIWAHLTMRHSYLIQNKNLIEKIKAKFNKILYGKNSIKNSRHKFNFEYIEPFKTVIFGTSNSAVNLLNRLSIGFNCVAACNTIDPNTLGKKLKGLNIIDMQQLRDIEKEIDCVIISSSQFYYQIKDMIIKETNISENKIVRIPQLKLAEQNLLY